MIFKDLIYKGVPYITFGSWCWFTGKNFPINKHYNVMGFEFCLRSWVPDFLDEDIYRRGVYDEINKHPELYIKDQYYTDLNETIEYVDLINIDGKCYSKHDHRPVLKFSHVEVKNQFGKFYVGMVDEAYRKVRMNLIEFQSSNLEAKDGTASVARYDGTDKYLGWSHRAAVSFDLGDKLFIEDFGDDNTNYKEHGTTKIKTREHARQAAANFAKYVS